MRATIRHRFPMVFEPRAEGPSNTLFLTNRYDAQVEDQLRTFMLNGTDPEELEPALSDEQKASER
jgi:hypothetical protein